LGKIPEKGRKKKVHPTNPQFFEKTGSSRTKIALVSSVGRLGARTKRGPFREPDVTRPYKLTQGGPKGKGILVPQIGQ